MMKKVIVKAVMTSAIVGTMILSGAGSYFIQNISISNVRSNIVNEYVQAAYKYSAPTLNSATVGDGKVVLKWTKSSNSNYYQIWRRINGGDWAKLNITSGTTYSDTSVESGNTYTYSLQYVSSKSSSATELSDYDHTGITVYYIDQPEVTSISNTYKGVKIKWNAVDGCSGYNIYRRYGTQPSYTKIKTITSQSKTSFIDKDAPKEGRKYYYVVTAYDSTAESVMDTVSSIVRIVQSKVQFKVKYEQSEARKMLKLVNNFRTGKSPWAWNSTNTTKVVYTDLGNLEYDYELEVIAMKRAAEIAVIYDHQRPNGSDWTTALSSVTWTSAGENIAYGYNTYEDVFNAWLETNSNYAGQGHRRNMLGTDFNSIGIGHCKVNGVHYWVQIFANKTGVSDRTKAVNTSKKVTFEMSSDDIEENKSTLKSLSATIKDYAPDAPDWGDITTASRKVILTWTKSGSSNGYEIYRSTSKKKGYKLIKTIAKGSRLTYTDNNSLKNGKTYYYKIRAYRKVNGKKVYGNYSKVLKVKVSKKSK